MNRNRRKSSNCPRIRVTLIFFRQFYTSVCVPRILSSLYYFQLFKKKPEIFLLLFFAIKWPNQVTGIEKFQVSEHFDFAVSFTLFIQVFFFLTAVRAVDQVIVSNDQALPVKH